MSRQVMHGYVDSRALWTIIICGLICGITWEVRDMCQRRRVRSARPSIPKRSIVSLGLIAGMLVFDATEMEDQNIGIDGTPPASDDEDDHFT